MVLSGVLEELERGMTNSCLLNCLLPGRLLSEIDYCLDKLQKDFRPL